MLYDQAAQQLFFSLGGNHSGSHLVIFGQDWLMKFDKV